MYIYKMVHDVIFAKCMDCALCIYTVSLCETDCCSKFKLYMYVDITIISMNLGSLLVVV